MNKRFIVAGSLRSAWVEGGLRPARAGSVAASSSRLRSTCPACRSRAPRWVEGGLRQARAGSVAASSSRLRSTCPACRSRAPRWVEGGLRQARAGSAAPDFSRRGPRARLGGYGHGGSARSTHDLLVSSANRACGLAVRVQEGLARLVAEGCRDPGRHRPGQLEGVGGASAQQSERGRYTPKESIPIHKSSGGGLFERAAARQTVERRGGREPPDVGFLMPVDELERLRQELDVDEAPASVFHVQATARLAAELTLHPGSYLGDLLQ